MQSELGARESQNSRLHANTPSSSRAEFCRGIGMGVFPALAIILLSYSSNSSMRSSLQVWPNSERVSQRSTASAASPIDPLYDIHQRARSTESAGTPILRDILDLETRLHDLGDIPTYTNEDVCYVMVISDNSFDAARTQVRSWVLEVPKTNYFLVHHASDDSGALPMIVKPPAIQDSTATWKRTELAIQHLQSENSTQHCKWWFIGTDASWVNPRSVLGLVQELPFWRSYSIGYIWHEQGWSKGVTYSAGLTIYSRQALAVIASKLQNSTSECLKRADDFVVDACAWEGGVTQIHTLTMEPTGQLGPGGDWTWQQPHHLMSWTALRTTKPDYHLNLLWGYYKDIYGNHSRGFELTNINNEGG